MTKQITKAPGPLVFPFVRMVPYGTYFQLVMNFHKIPLEMYVWNFEILIFNDLFQKYQIHHRETKNLNYMYLGNE